MTTLLLNYVWINLLFKKNQSKILSDAKLLEFETVNKNIQICEKIRNNWKKKERAAKVRKVKQKIMIKISKYRI